MNMHTPGPWEADDSGGYSSLKIRGLAGKRLVAIVVGESPEADDNACLIKSAPSLLNALRILADAAEARGIPVDGARAEIARATGGGE